MRPLIKYHGGKGLIYKKILPFFPKIIDFYIEPFAGAASLLINKPISNREIYNDKDKSITNLFKQVKTNHQNLIEIIKNYDYDENVYKNVKNEYKNLNIEDDEIKYAAFTFIVRRMSRGGLQGTFSRSKRISNGINAEKHAYLTSIDNIAERLKN